MKKLALLFIATGIAGTAFAQQNVTTGGQKYSLLEESTGAWCQYCPDGTVEVENMLTQNPHSIAVANHYGDAMQISDYSGWETNIYGSGWPGATISRISQGSGFKVSPRSSWSNYSSNISAQTAKFDVTMTHDYNPTTRTISITVEGKALEAMTGKFSFNAYVTEDKVTGTGSGYDQVNYYNTVSGHPMAGKGNPIVGFEHNHTTRALLGGSFGDNNWTDPAKDDTKTATYTYTLAPSEDEDNIHIIGFISMNEVAFDKREVLNAIEARLYPWPTNVNNVNQFADMQVFPNPANNYVVVRSHMSTPADVNITINNMVGQTLINKSYKAAGSLFAEKISLDNLSNGIYFVNINSNGSTETRKITVSK